MREGHLSPSNLRMTIARLTDALLSDEYGINGDAFDRLLELKRHYDGDRGVTILNRYVECTDGRWYYDHDETTAMVDEELATPPDLDHDPLDVDLDFYDDLS